MTNQPGNLRHVPRLTIDTEAIASRIRTLADTTLCGQCEIAVRVLTVNAAQLIIEVHRLHDALVTARLEAANLRAAIQAALGAGADGEPDPLAYLRDELPAPDDAAHGRGW